MRWTDSQRAILRAAEKPVEGAFDLQIVRLIHERTGITKAMRHVQEESKVNSDIPRNFVLFGHSPWDVITEISRKAKRKNGAGYVDSMFRGLSALAGEERRPLVLWLTEAHSMKPAAQELIIALLEHVTRDEKLSVRANLVISRVRVWINRDNDRTSKTYGQFIGDRRSRFIMSERLFKKASSVWDMTNEGLNQIDHLDFSEQENVLTAVV